MKTKTNFLRRSSAILILSVLAQAIWLCPLNTAAQPSQKHNRSGDLSAVQQQQGEQAITAQSLIEMLRNSWSQIGFIGQGRRPDPDLVRQLAPVIIRFFDELPTSMQATLLLYRWKQLAGPEMLPVIRRIFRTKAAPGLRNIALKRLYESAPEEGRELILEELRQPIPGVEVGTLSLLPDETLPELDENWVDNLEKGRGDRSVMSQLIERYGTAAVLPRVRAIYGGKAGQRICSDQTSLLAYFLRVDPAMGIELVKRELDAQGPGYTRCYAAALLYDVGRLQMTPELEALAIEQLNDPNLEIVTFAAMILGLHGSSGAENPLWQRLDQWYEEWKARAEDFPRTFDHSHPNFWPKQVGRALHEALAQSPAWVLDRDKLERLRQTILDKVELQDFNSRAGNIPGETRIIFYPSEDGWGMISVAQYHCPTFTALTAKLSQFSRDTTFTWYSFEQNQPEAEQVFSDLKAFLDGRGMNLEKRKAH